MNLLAADIGATNSRLIWDSPSGNGQAQYRNTEFDDLYQVIDRFLQDHGLRNDRIERMVLALPGPVVSDRVELTNIGWVVDRGELQQRFSAEAIILINDFQAAAVGAVYDSRLLMLHQGEPLGELGCAVVTGAGTGLGLAWFPDIGQQGCLPQPTEGGHSDFAPADAGQCRWLQQLARIHGHVSWERLLSGPGLQNLHACIAGGSPEQAPPAEDIVARADAGDRTARRVVEAFVELLGAWTGNLALQFNPPAGIYLCGGVTQHLAHWIEGGFSSAYLRKGRMNRQVARITVQLAMGQDPGLQGALRIARTAQNFATTIRNEDG